MQDVSVLHFLMRTRTLSSNGINYALSYAMRYCVLTKGFYDVLATYEDGILGV